MSAKPSSTGKPRQRRLRAPVRRELVLDAALKVFAERGYSAGMGEVAQAAGITRTVLYYYAPSKKDLFLEVVEAQITELLRYVAPALTSGGEQLEQVRASLDAALRFAEERPLGWRLINLRLDADEPEVAEVRGRVHETLAAAFIGLFRTDVEDLGIDPDSPRGRVMTEAGLGAATAVVVWWMEHPSVPREVVLDAMSDLFWHGVKTMTEQAAADRR